MLRKKRFSLGFKLGKAEHVTRERAYVLLAVGIVILGINIALFSSKWIYIVGGSIIGLAFLIETVSYMIHRLEKKTMDGLRRGK